jgi:SAM-dependent methyltransferase
VRASHNWLTHDIFRQNFSELAARHLRGSLIDIGCADKPWADTVAPFVGRHVGIDYLGCLHGLNRVDAISTAYALPFGDASFDCATATAVLEHLEEPEAAVRECARVLKAGGVAIYSVPFIWHLHEEPRDFYRYSRYGLEHLFTKCEFEIVEIRPLSGFWVTFGQLFAYVLQRWNRRWVRRTGIVTAAQYVVQSGAKILDRIDRDTRWTWMYMVAARRR